MSHAARQLLTEADIKEAKRLCGGSRGERVDFIFALMSNIQWKRGQTGRLLSEIWSMSQNTIDQYASEAYRRFKSQLGDPEELRGMIVAKIETVVDSAMQNTKTMLTKEGDSVEVAAPDHRSAIAGLMGIGELCGLKVRKTETKVRYEEYSRESLNELMEKAKGVLSGATITTEGETVHALTEGVPATPPNHSTQHHDAQERLRNRHPGREADR